MSKEAILERLYNMDNEKRKSLLKKIYSEFFVNNFEELDPKEFEELFDYIERQS